MPLYFPTYFDYTSHEITMPEDISPDNPLYGVTGLTKAYDYLPYSFNRIQDIMLYDYGIELEFIHPGYKGNRYPGYVNKYRLIDYYTREVVYPRVTLKQLRYFLAPRGHILHTPNLGAVAFLRAVENAKADMGKTTD